MASLAQKLIAKNKASKTKFLDLGNCGLTEIPSEVGDLVWLEGLSLDSDHEMTSRSRNNGGDNTLADLGPLPGMSRP